MQEYIFFGCEGKESLKNPDMIQIEIAGVANEIVENATVTSELEQILVS